MYPQVKPLLERLVAGKNGGENVFKIKDAKRAIAAACRRLKLPAYSHRSFRRMFITRAIERGVDVKVIAEWQGHKDGGKLILDTYSHVNPVHSHRMAQLLTDEAAPDRSVLAGVRDDLCRAGHGVPVQQRRRDRPAPAVVVADPDHRAGAGDRGPGCPPGPTPGARVGQG